MSYLPGSVTEEKSQISIIDEVSSLEICGWKHLQAVSIVYHRLTNAFLSAADSSEACWLTSCVLAAIAVLLATPAPPSN